MRRVCLLALVACLIFAANRGIAGERRTHEPIRPLTEAEGLDVRKVELGRRLFHDPILSGDGTISCASCHNLAKSGADGRPRSIGVKGGMGTVNAPTVYNAALNLAQFWDGRAATLEEQAGGPITNPVEMAATWPQVLARLSASPYRAEFKAIFGTDPSAEAVRDAISSFERTLITVDSRFDRWLDGDDSALTGTEKAGYARFKSLGCASCHQGRNVGGNMFQRFGFFGNWFTDRGRTETRDDLGRFNVTGQPGDRYVFKVPSLRLAALTAPYFHDGSVPTLEEAVTLMARYQLGRDISADDVSMIVAFLRTLPGRLAGDGR